MREDETENVVFEYRNGAYTEYVSNETQKIPRFLTVIAPNDDAP